MFGPIAPHPLNIVTSFPVIKRSEGEADHSPLYSIKVKSNWICTSTAAYLHVVATNLALGQSRLYFTSWIISLAADSTQYTRMLCGAYKEWRSERRYWYEQAFTSPAFIRSFPSALCLMKARNTDLC